MTQIGDQNVVETVMAEVVEINPPPARRRLRLGTVAECRREIAKLYIEARRGKIPTSEATRLTYIVVSLVNIIRDTELEERIAVLEAENSRQ